MSIMSTIADEHDEETKELRAEIKRHRREYQRLIERCNKSVELGIHIQGELDIVEAENTRLRELLIAEIDDGRAEVDDIGPQAWIEAALHPKKKGKL